MLATTEYQRECAEIRAELQRIESQITPLRREEDIRSCFAFFGTISSVALGTNLVVQGARDIGQGYALAGRVEVAGGVAILNDRDTLAPEVAINQATIRNLTQRQLQLKKQLYELEKAEALRLAALGHYLRPAIEHQFRAIDEVIAAGYFSPVHIDIAINTQRILNAETPEAMNSAVTKHRKLAIPPLPLDQKIFAAMAIVIALAAIAVGVMFCLGGIPTVGGLLVGLAAWIIPGATMLAVAAASLLLNKREDNIPLTVDQLAAADTASIFAPKIEIHY